MNSMEKKSSNKLLILGKLKKDYKYIQWQFLRESTDGLYVV